MNRQAARLSTHPVPPPAWLVARVTSEPLGGDVGINIRASWNSTEVAIATHAYSGYLEDDLSFEAGDPVSVMHKQNDGWFVFYLF